MKLFYHTVALFFAFIALTSAQFVSKEFKIVVVTQAADRAGTNEAVTLYLEDEAKRATVLKFVDPTGLLFENGHTDTFSLKQQVLDFGTSKRLSICLSSTNTYNPEWKVAEIFVNDVKFIFNREIQPGSCTEPVAAAA